MDNPSQMDLVIRAVEALERIADRLDLLTVETSQEPEAPTCRHPKDQRMALGATNGWTCQACGRTKRPS